MEQLRRDQTCPVRISKQAHAVARRYKKQTGLPIGRFIENAINFYIAELKKK